MQYAIVNGSKTLPQPKTMGLCPGCGADVIAKCGEVKTHHWAHKSLVECDSWWENEGEWHRNLKQVIGGNDPSRIEVTIRRDGRWHRADCISVDGYVVELQHSPISPADIRDREGFYGDKMIWVLDYTEKIPKHDVRLDTIKRRVVLYYGDSVVCIDGDDRWSMTKDEFTARITTEGVAFFDAEALIRAQRKAEREHHDRFYPIYLIEQRRIHGLLMIDEAKVQAEMHQELQEKDMVEIKALTPEPWIPTKGVGLLEKLMTPKIDLVGYCVDHGYITPRQALLYLKWWKTYPVDEFPWVCSWSIREDLKALTPEERRLVTPYLHPEVMQTITAQKLEQTYAERFKKSLQARFDATKDPIIWEYKTNVVQNLRYISRLKRLSHKNRMEIVMGFVDENLKPIEFDSRPLYYPPPDPDFDSYDDDAEFAELEQKRLENQIFVDDLLESLRIKGEDPADLENEDDIIWGCSK